MKNIMVLFLVLLLISCIGCETKEEYQKRDAIYKMEQKQLEIDKGMELSQTNGTFFSARDLTNTQIEIITNNGWELKSASTYQRNVCDFDGCHDVLARDYFFTK